QTFHQFHAHSSHFETLGRPWRCRAEGASLRTPLTPHCRSLTFIIRIMEPTGSSQLPSSTEPPIEPTAPAQQATPQPAQARSPIQRERFGPEELPIILSHYDIGVIDSIAEYPRGSRKAPKLLIVSEQGKFLLKRRARGKDDPFKVAFCHAIQLHLAAKQFPLPHLIGTRRENNSMLQWRNGVYELFEYIPGQGYPQTLEATFDSGRVLALYHKLLEGFRSEWQPPSGSYHMAPAVEQGLKAITSQLPSSSQPNEGDPTPVLEFLLESYSHSAEHADKEGIEQWPKQIVHADWHPGNMLFRDNHV